MNRLEEECIKITDDTDVIIHKYIFLLIASILSIIIGGPVLLVLLQNPKALNIFAFLRLSAPLILLTYVYLLGESIVSCKVCKGYLLLKGYGKPIKVDFDNICSINTADLVRELGKDKSLVAIQFWKKTALGQKVKIYLKKENLYKGERTDAEAYLVKLIKQYSIPK